MLGRVAFSFLLGILLTSTAQAAIQIVNDFGANGWYSWDTKNTVPQLSERAVSGFPRT